MNKLKFSVALMSAGLMFIGLSAVNTTSAIADSGIGGRVKCAPSGDAVVGMWINDLSDSSKSGWAGHSNTKDGAGYYTWGRAEVPLTHTYTVTVGCGGSAQSWGKTIYTYPGITFVGRKDVICNDGSAPWACG